MTLSLGFICSLLKSADIFLTDCNSLWIETTELEYLGVTKVEYGEGGGEDQIHPPI